MYSVVLAMSRQRGIYIKIESSSFVVNVETVHTSDNVTIDEETAIRHQCYEGNDNLAISQHI